jgi:hypothetical protein
MPRSASSVIALGPDAALPVWALVPGAGWGARGRVMEMPELPAFEVVALDMLLPSMGARSGSLLVGLAGLGGLELLRSWLQADARRAQLAAAQASRGRSKVTGSPDERWRTRARGATHQYRAPKGHELPA